MRTTLNISDALLEALRERSRQEKRPMTAVVDDVIRRGLAVRPAPAEPVRIPTFNVGIKPAYRGMSLNQLYDQLEAEDSVEVAEE